MRISVLFQIDFLWSFLIPLRFQFRDFLQLYNKLTEKCFLHCVDNLFTRSLSEYESSCLDKCVIKFSNVNQRVMSTYVREQTLINQRRLKEMEQQMQTINAAQEQSSAASSTGHSEPILASSEQATVATWLLNPDGILVYNLF